jgi:hypothetical protein
MMALYSFDISGTTPLNPRLHHSENLKYHTLVFILNFVYDLGFQHAEENPIISKDGDGESDGNSVHSESQHQDDNKPTTDSNSKDTPNKTGSDKSKKVSKITP